MPKLTELDRIRAAPDLHGAERDPLRAERDMLRAELDLLRAERLFTERFGHAALRPLQRKVIAGTLAGRDVLAILPTGAGKSVCFQLPSLLTSGVTVVVTPLIALMEDQVAGARRRGIAAERIDSTVGRARRDRILTALYRDEVRLLYAAPERLTDPLLLRALRHAGVARIAVDEAHCISEWGHDFRPSYRHLARLRAAVGQAPVTALTATATPDTRADIAANLELRMPAVVLSRVDRPNLKLEVVRVASLADGVQLLRRRLRQNPGAAIVYAPTRRRAGRLAQSLVRFGVPAAAYHAGMDPGPRSRVQAAFLSDRVRVVCATSAFGMGVDHATVRLVCHLGLPGSLEAYVQEAGRAGRDGRDARCTLIEGSADVKLLRLRARVDSRELDRRTLRRLRERARLRLRAVRRYVRARGCRRAEIAAYFGEPAPICAGCDNCAALALSEVERPEL